MLMRTTQPSSLVLWDTHATCTPYLNNHYTDFDDGRIYEHHCSYDLRFWPFPGLIELRAFLILIDLCAVRLGS
jgi:hypothetical protein